MSELPYSKQMANKNMIIVGLWFGEKARHFSNPTHARLQHLKRGLRWSLPSEEHFIAEEFCWPVLVIFLSVAYFAMVCSTMARMGAGNVYSLVKLCEQVLVVTLKHFSTKKVTQRVHLKLLKVFVKRQFKQLIANNWESYGLW